ncbi:MAG: glycoside hydrolase [Christiangramia sp.]
MNLLYYRLPKLITIFAMAFLMISSVSSCQNNEESTSSQNDDSSPSTSTLQLRINPEQTYQTMENFGASDAWSGQFVGNWPYEKKTAIADLLFSNETDANGNPEGIALSLWRFNLGGGSAAQGDASGIADSWRRGESFIVPETGEYNWNKMSGQVWLAKAAKERGVENLLVFTNSPPVTLTRNNKAFTSDANQSNLAPSNYDEFAQYLADVMQGMANIGLPVDYLSPVNEPQWDWTGGQEGTPFFNNEIAGIVKAIHSEFTERNLSQKIDIAEAGQINFLYEEGDKPNRSRQIPEFFETASENYIGNLKNVSRNISGHSYFTTSPSSKMLEMRKELAAKIENVPDLGYWMTEYCILGDNNGEIDGNGKDLGITSALYLAKVIHADLSVAQASAWHWWLAISPYDYKDGLIYIDKNKNDGNFSDSKMLWALGNYSRFIRPGSKRIGINSSTEPNEDFLYSAYKDSETGKTVVVIINSKYDEVAIEFTDLSSNNLQAYVTSEAKDLSKSDLFINGSIIIPKRSITTLIL